MTAKCRWERFRAGPSQEGGYVAVMTALLLIVLMGLAAFAVDVGRLYVVGQQEQNAADAAALAGVTSLPGNVVGAVTAAKKFSKINGFQDGVAATTVTAAQEGKATRLRVTVRRTVDNIFGPLLGVRQSTVSRTAVADFGGPLPMGSPCNEFGNDPEPGSNRGNACLNVSGQMWANVNSPGSDKANGDAYQSTKSCSSAVDGCTGSTNTDYATDGYFYTVSVKPGMTGSLTIQLFDPVFVDVGLTCDASTSQTTTHFGKTGSSSDPLSTGAVNYLVTAADAGTRYKPGASEPYCTGDNMYDSHNSQVMNTQFTVREPSPSLWNPVTFPQVAGCQKTYPGYSGNLFNVLDQYTSGTTKRSTYNKDSTGSTTSPTIVEGFRQWTTLCTISAPKVGDYVIQVKTNVGGSFDNANAGNRFAMRAYGSGNLDKNLVSISGREKMGIYSNKPGALTTFHLARVPSGAAGQMLNVRLFDVGDSNQAGTIKIIFPPDVDAVGGPFTGCQGAGPASGLLTGCGFPVKWLTNTNPPQSDHQGKWQTVSVSIPANYECTDSDPASCWVRLQYDYGSGAAPTDVTSWAGNIDGDPVRLLE